MIAATPALGASGVPTAAGSGCRPNTSQVCSASACAHSMMSSSSTVSTLRSSMRISPCTITVSTSEPRTSCASREVSMAIGTRCGFQILTMMMSASLPGLDRAGHVIHADDLGAIDRRHLQELSGRDQVRIVQFEALPARRQEHVLPDGIIGPVHAAGVRAEPDQDAGLDQFGDRQAALEEIDAPRARTVERRVCRSRPGSRPCAH